MHIVFGQSLVRVALHVAIIDRLYQARAMTLCFLPGIDRAVMIEST